MTYKWCAVPECRNTSIKTPKKLFVRVPDNIKKRKKWLHLARRNPYDISLKSVIYFCEDHFDLPNDMQNYMQYHLLGSVQRVLMTPMCLPSKFDCQYQGEKERTTDDLDNCGIRQRKELVESLLRNDKQKESKKASKKSMHLSNSTADKSNEETDEAIFEVYQTSEHMEILPDLPMISSDEYIRNPRMKRKCGQPRQSSSICSEHLDSHEQQLCQMPLTPAERQKKYREKLKRENPKKFEELKKKTAECASRYYKKKASQYTEEQKEERRQKWREERNKQNQVEQGKARAGLDNPIKIQKTQNQEYKLRKENKQLTLEIQTLRKGLEALRKKYYRRSKKLDQLNKALQDIQGTNENIQQAGTSKANTKKTSQPQDFSDEEPLELMGETTDEADLLDYETVFVNSLEDEENLSEYDHKQLKRACLDTSEVPSDFADQVYEFAKYVAEQLMCLDIQDARIAQMEIRNVLTKFCESKHSLTEHSTNVQTEEVWSSVEDWSCATAMTKAAAPVNTVSSVKSHSKQINSRRSVNRPRLRVNTGRLPVTQSVASQMNARPAVTQLSFKVFSGPARTQPSPKPPGPLSSKYHPKVEANLVTPSCLTSFVNAEGSSVTQSRSETSVGSTVQSGLLDTKTEDIAGISKSSEALSVNFWEILVKIEPGCESPHSPVNVTQPSVVGTETLQLNIKSEPDSDDKEINV